MIDRVPPRAFSLNPRQGDLPFLLPPYSPVFRLLRPLN
jgi:hypothetical protein